MIRSLVEGDEVAIENLIRSTDLLRSGWEPTAPPRVPAAVQPLLLRHQLATGSLVGMLDETAGRVGGVILAAELDQPLRGHRTTWVVDEFHVAHPRDWITVGRSLLVSLAARAASSGVDLVLIRTGSGDQAKRETLERTGLTRASWARRKEIGARPATPPSGVRGLVDADETEVAPLIAAAAEHLSPTACAGNASSGGLVVDDGDGPVGVALVRDGGTPGETVIDPLVLCDGASWPLVGERLVDGVEWLAASRGDRAIVVPCGPGEGLKESLLTVLGYELTEEWWTFRA